MPRNKATANATLKVNERTNVTLAGTWVSDSVDTDYWVGSVRRLPDYFLLDASVTWALDDHVSLKLTGKNLLDTRYETVWGYATPGRTLFAELTAQY